MEKRAGWGIEYPEELRNGDREYWPAPGSEDTELGVILEPEVVYGTQTLCTRVQA